MNGSGLLVSGNSGSGNVGPNSCVEILEPDWPTADSVPIPTILGYQLNGNPYSVANMRAASINLYGNNGNIIANRKYVRYKPATENQVQALFNSGLDFYDYPLDREVVEEGDYYPQPGIGENEIPWYYTVVDISVTAIPGIQYELISEIYVPDIDLALENEALRITGNPYNEGCSTGGGGESLVPEPCELNPCSPACPPNPDCGGGGGGGGNPGADTRKPGGFIRVWDSNIGTNLPVRRTKLVARRWLKHEAVFTDDNGHFQFTKRFRNRVNVLVKFENSHLEARGLRGSRIYQMAFPIKYGIGIYSGSLNGIEYIFTPDPVKSSSRKYRNWWAAQLMNAYLEYNTMAGQLGTGLLPNGMNILLTNWAGAGGGGSTPMNNHRINAGTWPQAFIEFYLVNNGGYASATLVNALYNSVFLPTQDMSLGYRVNINFWQSDLIKYLMWHELSHAAHYNKVGDTWWNSFVFSEATTISINGLNGQFSPYGNGQNGVYSQYISVGESWADHMGRTMADLWYAASSSEQFKQEMLYQTNGNIWDVGAASFFFTGLRPHINLLEDFSPFRTGDPFHWIPYGIFHDLSDNRNDQAFIRVSIDDQVNVYTNGQFFNALDPDIISIPQYRSRLLQENGNNQSLQVNTLFQAYGY